MTNFMKLLTITFLFFIPFITQGHEKIHSMIEANTKEISKSPNNHTLYIKRAILHEQQQHWKEAFVDLTRAEKLKPKAFDYNHIRGRIMLEQNKLIEAISFFDKSTQSHPDSGMSFLLKGRSYFNLKKYEEASENFDKGISKLTSPQATYFIEQSRAHLLNLESSPEKAASCLEIGIKKLGEDITLQNELLNIFEKTQKYDRAFSLVSRIIEQVTRKESWLIRRAGILIKLGKNDLAQKDLKRVFDIFGNMPERVRNRKHNQDLINKARDILINIK